MKVASAVGVVARVAGRVLLWLMPTLLAYVDYEFGSMDFSWDSNEDRCNLGEIFANIDKFLSIGTYQRFARSMRNACASGTTVKICRCSLWRMR